MIRINLKGAIDAARQLLGPHRKEDLPTSTTSKLSLCLIDDEDTLMSAYSKEHRRV